VRAGDWLRPAAGRADWHRVADRLDYAPRLAELALPVLLLCGRHDPQYPPACTAELAAGIRGARVVWLDDSGHFPFLEQPAVFWPAVGAFLGTPQRPGPAAPPGPAGAR
jgi:proline iminopeptidase